MKREEIDKNPEFKNELLREIEEKARETHDPIGAETEVLKAHGIEFDEDALRAAAVEKMKLNEDALENVSGGYDDWCVADYACFYILKHPSKHYAEDNNAVYIGHEACFNDWICFCIQEAD